MVFKPYYLRRLEREHARLSALMYRYRSQARRYFERRLLPYIRSRTERRRIAEAVARAIARAVRRGDVELVSVRLTGVRDRRLRRQIRRLIEEYAESQRDLLIDWYRTHRALVELSYEESLWLRYSDQILQAYQILFSASRGRRGVEWIDRQFDRYAIPDEVREYVLQRWSQMWGFRHYSLTFADVSELCDFLAQMAEILPATKWKVNAIICGEEIESGGERKECVTERIWVGRAQDFDCREVSSLIDGAVQRWSAFGLGVYLHSIQLHAL